ncbi:MAG: lysine--tRNA ligase [Anaerolineales bacterium]|nr:MAG: lysine--tRNA ligase [Anaerolineales bacterium]
MLEDFGDQVQQRMLKLQRLREQGTEPYPARAGRSHTAAEALAAFEETEAAGGEPPTVQVVGRLRAIRVMGKSAFAHVEDGSGRIQVYLKQDVLGESAFEIFKRDFDLGDFIGIEGHLFRTRTGEVTVYVRSYQILAKALHPLPEKWHGLKDVETRYRRRYLDLIANEDVRRIFITRTRIVSAMRRFLDEQGFLEVETPTLQPIYGGAMARPFTTHHNALDMTLYLRISDELYLKRLIVGGLDKVYEICKDFRNEGVSTKHNPEFTQMECYWAYADYNDMMWLTEHMVAFIAEQALGSMQFTFQGHQIDVTPPWRRWSLRDAIRELAEIDYMDFPTLDALWTEVQRRGLGMSPQPTWGKLIDELLGEIVEPTLIQPTFIKDYPIDISPLAKALPDDPQTVERFEIFIGGLETGNAYSELNDPIGQRERFEQQGVGAKAGDEEAHPMDEDYVLALMHGMPPTGGLGVGVDRLTMLLTDQTSIREVILFPHMRSEE